MIFNQGCKCLSQIGHYYHSLLPCALTRNLFQCLTLHRDRTSSPLNLINTKEPAGTAEKPSFSDMQSYGRVRVQLLWFHLGLEVNIGNLCSSVHMCNTESHLSQGLLMTLSNLWDLHYQGQILPILQEQWMGMTSKQLKPFVTVCWVVCGIEHFMTAWSLFGKLHTHSIWLIMARPFKCCNGKCILFK